MKDIRKLTRAELEKWRKNVHYNSMGILAAMILIGFFAFRVHTFAAGFVFGLSVFIGAIAFTIADVSIKESDEEE